MVTTERGRLLSSQVPQLSSSASEVNRGNGDLIPIIHIKDLNHNIEKMKWDSSIRSRAQEYAARIEKTELADEKKGTLNGLIDFSQRIWGQIDEDQQAELEKIVKGATFHVAQTDRVYAAKSLIAWEDTIPHAGNGNRFPTQMSDLLKILHHKDFDSLGSILQKSLRSGALPFEDIIDEHRDEIDPQLVDEEKIIRRMIDCFIGAGFVRITNTTRKLSLTDDGRSSSQIGHDELKNAQLSYEALDTGEGSTRKIKTMDDIKNIYQVSKERSAIDEIDITLDKPSRKTLYLSEILLGNNTSDIDFLDKTIERIGTMSEEEKPDVIIVSGLLQGAFKYRQKDRRDTLIEDDKGNKWGANEQFQASRTVLDKLLALGVRVIYNISNEDLEICRDYNIDVMKMMNKKGKPLADTDKQFVTYWQQDQLQQDKAWDIHRNFQTNVVFEYCLRSGRNLRSADKVAAFTNGKLRMEEYLMLRHIYQEVESGKSIDTVWKDIPESWKEIVEQYNIPFPGKKFNDFEVINNANIKTTIKTRDGSTKESTDKLFHGLNLSKEPLYANPTAAAESLMNQWLSSGREAPQTISIQDQQMGFGTGMEDNKWVLSMPGNLNSYEAVEQKGSVMTAGISPALRHLTTRRIGARPAATMHEFTDDDRHIVSIFNEKLLDKADSLPDRTTVAFCNDWQTGSITARPDFAVKFLDMIRSGLLPNRPTLVFFAGDLIQGRNYPNMPNENQHMELIRIDTQVEIVKRLLELSFQDVSKEDLENLKHVGSLLGNHEYNSRTVDTGAGHMRYIPDYFDKLFASAGISPEAGRVVFYDTVATRYGDYLKSWTARKDIGEYGLLVKHLPLVKGGKGSGNKAPVYQFQQMHEGIRGLASNVDVSFAGHYHHPQYLLENDRVGVIGGSSAQLSEFELERALWPVPGATTIDFGGSKPVDIEFISANTFHRYEIQNGYFTRENLAKEGFVDDRHFDPASHGFANRGDPRSGLHKAIWHMTYEVNDQTQSRF